MLGLRKPSPAMVVACISLFIGLSGVGTAAVVVLKKNSVLSKHIRNGQVKTADLGANAVNSAKVGDGSLLAQDFAAGQLPAGPQGLQGPEGPQGVQGPPGPTAAAVNGTTTPPAQSDGADITTTMITTTAPGKLLVSADLSAQTQGSGPGVGCDAAFCSVTFGIYVDGTPVPEAARIVSAGASATVTVPAIILRGILPNVAAGTHTVALRWERTTGSATFISHPNAQVQAIAIG